MHSTWKCYTPALFSVSEESSNHYRSYYYYSFATLTRRPPAKTMALHYAETRHAVHIARRVDITTTERNAGYIADSESLQSAPLGVAYTDSMSGSRQNLVGALLYSVLENNVLEPFFPIQSLKHYQDLSIGFRWKMSSLDCICKI